MESWTRPGGKEGFWGGGCYTRPPWHAAHLRLASYFTAGNMSARKKDKNSKIIWTSSSRMSGSGSFRGPKDALGGKEGPKVKLPCAEAVSVQQVRKLQKIL